MKKIIFITLFSVAFISLFAQTKHKVKKPDTRYHPWDTLRYKNEFSLDVKPVFFILLTANPETSQWEFGYTYRRFFDKRNALRIGNRFQFYNYYYSYYALGQTYLSNFPRNEIPIGSDTVVNLSETISDAKNDLNLRLGYEHRFCKGRVKFILGFDVINGVSFQNRNETFTPAIIQRVNNTDYFLRPLAEEFIYEKSVFYKIGISPIVGMNIHISKRFSFNAAFTPEVSWLFPIKQQNARYNMGGLNINLWGWISDLSLTVHF